MLIAKFIVKLLTPVREVSRELEASKVPTAHRVLPLFVYLVEETMKTINGTNDSDDKKFAQALLISLWQRFHDALFKKSWATVAAFLSPKVHLVSEMKRLKTVFDTLG